MKQFRTPLALAACAIALSACGTGAGDEEKASGSSGSLGVARAVVIDYLGATFSGDARACDLESQKYTTEQNEAVGAKDCAERVESVKALMIDGEPLVDVELATVEVSADGDGVLAKVGHETEDLDGTYRLVEVEGSWKIDGEVAVEASSDEEAGAVSAPGEPRAISEEEAKAKAGAFCAVEVGTARAEVERILGEPSAEGTDDDGQAEIDWYYNQDSYTVWFDDKGRVSASSSSTPRDDSPCPS